MFARPLRAAKMTKPRGRPSPGIGVAPRNAGAQVSTAVRNLRTASATMSASVSTGEPTWSSTVQPVTFVQGTPDTRSMLSYMTNFNSSLHALSVSSGNEATLNAMGVTLDPTVGYVYNGTSPIASPLSMELTIVDTAAADFAARSAGAFYAENWSSYADAEAAYNAPARAYANKSPASGSFANAFELITTAGHVLSGKALRLWHGKNNYGSAGTIDNQAWGVMFNGNRGNIPGAYKTKVYVQICFWVDSFIDYYWRLGDGSVGGSKFFIIDDWDATSSAGEVVVTDGKNLQFPQPYRQIGSSAVGIERSLSTPVNNFNYSKQNAVDRGTALTDQASYNRRYGPLYAGMTGGSSQASKLSTQGIPDPDAAIGGVAFNRGGITVIEVECDLAADRCRVWAAHHGNAPILINDTSLDNTSGNTAGFGARIGSQGIGWSAVTLSNLIYTATGAQNPNYPTDAYTDYCELIFSPTPINFPGGFVLPGV